MERSVVVLSAIPKLLFHLMVQAPNVTFHAVAPGTTDAVSKLQQTQIVVADPDLLILHLDHLQSVKWVQTTWAGLDKLTPHLVGREIPYRISRYSDAKFGLAMSEYVLAGIINHERNQRSQYENQKTKTWSQDGRISQHRLISDLTVGILGIGSIGKHVAQLLNAFGATVWGLSRTVPANNLTYLDRHVTTEDLPEILRGCDYVINILPLTNQTRGLLNGDVLKNCEEKKSVFINVGRGNVIRETDLVRALEEGWISAAILDVFEQEPLPETSKLWAMPQVTISPHVSAVTHAKGIAEAFVKNYEKYLKGEEIPNTFEMNRGY